MVFLYFFLENQLVELAADGDEDHGYSGDE